MTATLLHNVNSYICEQLGSRLRELECDARGGRGGCIWCVLEPYAISKQLRQLLEGQPSSAGGNSVCGHLLLAAGDATPTTEVITFILARSNVLIINRRMHGNLVLPVAAGVGVAAGRSIAGGTGAMPGALPPLAASPSGTPPFNCTLLDRLGCPLTLQTQLSADEDRRARLAAGWHACLLPGGLAAVSVRRVAMCGSLAAACRLPPATTAAARTGSALLAGKGCMPDCSSQYSDISADDVTCTSIAGRPGSEEEPGCHELC